MKKRLLNLKSIDKICANCAYGKHAPDDENILCEKRGVMLYNSSCRKFKYDPLNRIPVRPVLMDEHSWEEFVL